jgi:hypothetical protein
VCQGGGRRGQNDKEEAEAAAAFDEIFESKHDASES